MISVCYWRYICGNHMKSLSYFLYISGNHNNPCLIAYTYVGTKGSPCLIDYTSVGTRGSPCLIHYALIMICWHVHTLWLCVLWDWAVCMCAVPPLLHATRYAATYDTNNMHWGGVGVALLMTQARRWVMQCRRMSHTWLAKCACHRHRLAGLGLIRTTHNTC